MVLESKKKQILIYTFYDNMFNLFYFIWNVFRKSNEEKNKKKNRRKSMEVSKTEKKPTNTIKVNKSNHNNKKLLFNILMFF